MRLRKLKVKSFRNLKNFEVDFDDVPITVLLGKNGSAKSNLVEFIAHIFSELELEEDTTHPYYLAYECRTREIIIDAKYSDSEKISVLIGKRINDEITTDIEYEEITYSQFVTKSLKEYQDYLPTNIIIYYSGLSNRLEKVSRRIEQKYIFSLKANNTPPLRRLFLTNGSHSSLILFSFLADSSKWAEDFLRERMGIVGIESVLLQLISKKKKKESLPRNIISRLERLSQNTISLRDYGTYDTVNPLVRWLDTPKKIFFYFNQQFSPKTLIFDEKTSLEDKTKHAEKKSKLVFSRTKDLFQSLDDFNLVKFDLTIHFKLKLERAREPVPLTHLSEGEQQLLTVIGLLRFTKDNDTLFLLDEPDTHLNPQWSYEYKQILEEAMQSSNRGDQSSQIIMATHDPVLIADMVKQNIRLMERKSRKGVETPDEVEYVVEAKRPSENPSDLGIARILREIQDLPSILGPDKLAKLEEKRMLAFKDEPLTKDEERRLEELTIETEEIDLSTQIEDPLYIYFLNEIVNHKDYGLLKRNLTHENYFERLKTISQEARENLLEKAREAEAEK